MLRSKSHSYFAAALAVAAVAFTIATPAFAQSGPGNRPPVVAQPLTADEVKWLQFMREEEKLARDIYNALFEKWNLPVFKNIAASEQTHFANIGTLIERYGVADPAQSSPGVFVDPTLSALYSQLLAKGLTSPQDALEVGVLVEKQDILDLENASKATTRFDLKRVFANLMNASHNHLEAFETVCTLTLTAN